MKTMDPAARRAFLAAKTAHRELVEACAALREHVKTCPDPEELADIAFALHRANGYLDEAHKRGREVKTLAEKLACTLHVTVNPTERSIHTQYVVATPDVKQQATLPHRDRDPERYGAMMDALGVPRDLWETNGQRRHSCVTDHWPGLMERISERAAEGKPPLPGVDPEKTYPVYKLVLNGRKEPDED